MLSCPGSPPEGQRVASSSSPGCLSFLTLAVGRIPRTMGYPRMTRNLFTIHAHGVNEARLDEFRRSPRACEPCLSTFCRHFREPRISVES